MIPTGERYTKVKESSKVNKRYIKVQGVEKVPRGPTYPKRT